MLNDTSFRQTLAEDPLDGSGPITLRALATADLAGSVVVSRVLLLIRHARDNDGIGLTKGGALNRSFLAWAVDAFTWPDWDHDTLYAVNKVVDEGDYLPGAYLHEVLRRTRMLRKVRDRLVLTPLGRATIDAPQDLQRTLFRPIFAGRPLDALDHAFRGGFHQYFGLLLWELKGAASAWAPVATAYERCVSPADSIRRFGAPHERWGEYAFYLRVLRPLSWFGVTEVDKDGERWFDPDRWRVRNTQLFDRFIHFDTKAAGSVRVLH